MQNTIDVVMNFAVIKNVTVKSSHSIISLYRSDIRVNVGNESGTYFFFR